MNAWMDYKVHYEFLEQIYRQLNRMGENQISKIFRVYIIYTKSWFKATEKFMRETI